MAIGPGIGLVLPFFLCACAGTSAGAGVWDDLQTDLQAWPFGENFAFQVGNASGSLFVFERGTTTMNSQLVMESGSKWPSASAIAGLVADGTISSFDDPVNKYVSYWTRNSSDPRSQITLRHLLSFRSGYLSNAGNVPCEIETKTGDFDACTKELYEKIQLGGKPGAVWDYNSYHLQFAGAMATAASGLTINEVLDKYLLKKLEMVNSTYGGTNPQVATSLITTGNDFQKFLQAFHDYTLLPKTVITEMEKDYTAYPVQPSGDGWFGHYCMGHWFECLGYAQGQAKGAGANLTQACISDNIHAGPGLYGYYPLIDRSRGYYLQLVVQESYQKSGIPEYLRIAAKPTVDIIMAGGDPQNTPRSKAASLTFDDIAFIAGELQKSTDKPGRL